MKILLVDDDPTVREHLSRSLTVRGYSLATAIDGQDALTHIQNAPPDLILTDIRMPEMDGIDLLRAVHAQYPNLPVIVMTGDRDLDIAVDAFRSGACDYLKKPIRLEELLARIQSLIPT